jgi:glycosyltransferase involved in cell wall biosynthesis
MQSCRNFEHLIMDGASTDGTVSLAQADAAESLRRVYSSPDNGLYDAMNHGMEIAAGDYLIFLNAGDTFHSSETLAHMEQAIVSNNYPGIVYGQTDIVDINCKKLGNRHLTAPEHLSLKSFRNGMVVCHQSMAVLKRITSPYDLSYRFSADFEWCIRCLQHSRHNVYVPEVIADYLSEGLTSANRRKSLLERFKIMCYYYGTIPTILRHLKFIPRFIRQQRLERKSKAITQ